MANHKSAAKRARQTIRKAARNHSIRKTIRTVEKKLRQAISDKKADEAQSLLREFTSRTGKAAQKGILHQRNVARRVSRLAAQTSGLSK